MKADGKSSYRDTPVSWIPLGWDLVRLGDVANESRHRNSGQLKDSLLCGVLKNQGLAPMRNRVKGDSTNRCLIVEPDSFAYNPMRLNIGSVAKNTTKHAVMVSPDYVVFSVDNQKLLSGYLDQLRRSGIWESFVGATGDGSVRVRIYFDQLALLKFPLPPLSEQKQIVSILTTIDDKLEVLARQITATQFLQRGLMQSLFSRGLSTQDAEGNWIPHSDFMHGECGDVPTSWVIRSLESIASVERGKFSARPRNDPRYFKEGTIPFIQTGDVAGASRFVERASQFINDEGLAVSKCFPANTIFVTIAANIGDVAFARIPMACPDSVVGINVNANVCDRIWLYYFLRNSKAHFDGLATQNAQKNINLQVLKPFLIALPPLNEQRRMAEVLTALDDKIDGLKAKQSHYQTLKRGMMQKLLTGEWRVKLDDMAHAPSAKAA